MLTEFVCHALVVSTSGDGVANLTVLCDVPNNLGLSKAVISLGFGSLLRTMAEVDIDSVVLSSTIGSSILSYLAVSAFA